MLKGIILAATGGLCVALVGVFLIGNPVGTGAADGLIVKTLVVFGTIFFVVLFAPIRDPLSVQRSHVIAAPTRLRKKSIWGFIPHWVGKMGTGAIDSIEANRPKALKRRRKALQGNP